MKSVTRPSQRTARQQNRLLRYFSLMYILLLLTPVFVFVSSMSGTTSMLTQQYEDSSVSMVESAALQAEAALSLIEHIQSETLPRLNEFNRIFLSIAGGTSFDALDVRALFEAMPVLSDTSGLIRGYMLYHWRGDFLVEPGLGYQQAYTMYPDFLSYGEMDYAQWKQEILLSPLPRITYPAAACHLSGNSYSCILKSFSYSAGGKKTVGRVLFFLDANRLCSLFEPLLENGSTRALIFDADGNLLTSRGPVEEQDLSLSGQLAAGLGTLQWEGELASYYCVPGGWSYVVMTPKVLFVRQAMQALSPAMTIIGLILLAAIILGATFFHRQSSPLGRIVRILPGQSKRAPQSLSEIEQAIIDLKENKQMLEDQAALQAIQLRDACLNQLINGTLFGEKSFDDLLQAADISLSGQRFRAAYMLLSGSSEGDEVMNRSMISECLMQCKEQVQLFTPVAPRRYVLILSCETDNAEHDPTCHLLARLHTAINNQCHLDAVFYVGVCVSTLESIHFSLESARSVMYVGNREEQFLFIAEESNAACYDYTDRQEALLQQFVNGGRGEEVHQLLGKIYLRNFSQLSLDGYQVHLLYARICNTLLLCSSGLPLKPPAALLSLHANRDGYEFFQQVEQYLLRLCELARTQHATESGKVAGRIVEYIGAEFCRADMSLGHLSIQFGLTESYLSTMLHERLGQGFASYLEKLRIERAMQMLRERPEINMEELSAAVGYSSVRTFQRAFARVADCSPSSFRKTLQKPSGA